MRLASIIVAALVLASIGCSQQQWDSYWKRPWHVQDLFQKQPESPGQTLVSQIEQAHGAAAWKQHKALQCELALDMNDSRVIDGTMTFTTDNRRSRIDIK